MLYFGVCFIRGGFKVTALSQGFAIIDENMKFSCSLNSQITRSMSNFCWRQRLEFFNGSLETLLNRNPY